MAQILIMNRGTKPYIFLIALIAIEIGCHSALQAVFNQVILSIIYFSLGIIIPIWILILCHSDFSRKLEKYTISKVGNVTSILWLVLLILLFYHYASIQINSVPIDYRMADMIPVIQTMTSRFVSGQEVYATIPEIWNGIQPIYLPALWMPFIVSEVANIDPRWVPITGITFSIVMLTWMSRIHKYSFYATVFSSLALITSIAVLDPSLITLTQEGVVIFYYVFLGIALVYKKPIMISLALTLCLLSRFSLIGWGIAFVIGVWIVKPKRDFLILTISGIVIGTGLLWISGAINHIEMFVNLPGHYVDAVMNDYEKFNPTIQYNLGLAKFFDFPALGKMNQLNTLIAFVLPLLLIMVYLKNRDHYDFYIYSLIGLKLCLVFVLNLIIIPYSYLFYTSSFLSIALIPIIVNNYSLKIATQDAEAK